MDSKELLAAAKKVFEIQSQAVAQLSTQLDDDFAQAIQLILASEGRVIVCGMGKSGHIGKKIAATLASTGTRAYFMHPAEAFHGDLGMVAAEDVFIGISNSGETEELIRLLPALKANGNAFISITGKPASTMARNSTVVLNTAVSREACPLELAPTASTTAALVMGDALAVVLMQQRGFKAEQFARFHPGGSLGRKLLTKVADVMRTDRLPFIPIEADFRQLVLKMSEGKLGMALVMQGQQLVGIITDGDLRRSWTRQSSSGEGIAHLPISSLMTRNPKSVSPDVSLAEAEQLMVELKITTLVVSTQNQQVTGVLQLYGIK